MKKPKVLIVCPFYPPNLGGVESHLALLTDYLSNHGYNTTVLTCKPLMTKIKKYLRYETRRNLKIHRFWWFSGGLFDKTTPCPWMQFFYIIPGLLIRSMFFLFKSDKKFDVVHAHGFAGGFIARVLTILFPIKRKVISTHFIYPQMKKGSFSAKIFRWVFSGFDKILLIGEASRQQLQGMGIDGAKMEVFHHWLDPKVFFPKDRKFCQKKLQLPAAKLVALYVGRVLRMKGVFNLLKVAESISREILFIIVGDGPDFEELKIKAEGITNVFLAGRISHEEVIDFLGAADFLILPSIAEEAQPMVVMEALMCGRPVVTTNKGAVGEMFNDKVGLTINPSVAKIKKTICDFYENPTKLEAMAGKARNFALKKYGPVNAKIITNSYQ